MKKDEVPQDNSRTYGGHRKLLYAETKDGAYEAVQSSGWEPETAATLSAVNEFDALAKQALASWQAGTGSALEYWMCKRRMDIPTLAQASGFFTWRVKRHLRELNTARLPQKILQRYSTALGITVELLKAPQ